MALREHYALQFRRLSTANEVAFKATHKRSPVPATLQEFTTELLDLELSGKSRAEAEKVFITRLSERFSEVFAFRAKNITEIQGAYAESLAFLAGIRAPRAYPPAEASLIALNSLSDQVATLAASLAQPVGRDTSALWERQYEGGSAAVKACDLILDDIISVINEARNARQAAEQFALAKQANDIAGAANSKSDESNGLAKQANELSGESNSIAKEANTKAADANLLAAQANKRATWANWLAVGCALLGAIATLLATQPIAEAIAKKVLNEHTLAQQEQGPAPAPPPVDDKRPAADRAPTPDETTDQTGGKTPATPSQ